VSCGADPRTMAHGARLDEIARLLVRAWLRARVRATARPVRHVARSVARVAGMAASAPRPAPETALALCSEAEPPCPRRERRDPPTRVPPTGDASEENL
jgi:hypothetical protein